MSDSFYSPVVLQYYIDGIKSSTDPDEAIKKSQHVSQWLHWLLEKKLITSEQYASGVADVNAAVEKKVKRQSSKVVPSISYLSKIGSFLKNGNNKYVGGLLIIIALTLLNGYFYYNQSKVSPSTVAVKTLPYEGSLTEKDGKPVTTKKDISFSLYNTYRGSQPLYRGSCMGQDGIVPDYKGRFSVVIGSDCAMSPIPSELFQNYSVLYLGVTVGSDKELEPRLKVITAGYSRDAGLLEGFERGTGTSMIPFIDNTGSIQIDAQNPSLKSTQGTFSVEGQSMTFKTTHTENGSILFQPAVNANTIIGTGRLGIGTFTPEYLLSAMSAEPYSSVGSIKNLADLDDPATSVLKLHLGTPTSGVSAQFIQFYAGADKTTDGTQVGSIGINNEGVIYETAGADFAEYFEVEDAQLPTGTIVTLSSTGIHLSQQGEPIVGVVSDKAGFVGNSSKDNVSSHQALVALTGQIDVYVSTLNGAIEKGDTIGLSMIPGYGMKSSHSDRGVGYTLESLNSHGRVVACPTEYDELQDIHGQPIICSKVRVLLAQ